VQRCCAHKLRNLACKAPKHALADIRDDFHRIVYAGSGEAARTAFAAFERTWAKRCPGVVTSLREGGHELLTFFRFPNTQWKTLRTTNVIERLHEEFRRRVKTQGSLPTEDAALVLLFSLVASGQVRLRRIGEQSPRCYASTRRWRHDASKTPRSLDPAVGAAAGRSGDRVMERRAFIVGGCALLASPIAAEAQQTGKRVPRVGVLATGVNPRSASFYAAFEQRLRELGYVEGQSITIDFRIPSAAQDLSEVAAALVQSNPDVLMVPGPEASLKAAIRATKKIPIVMVAMNYDPIALGYVASLFKPGGNITGLFSRSPELTAKQLELLREALPRATTIAVLWEANSADQVRAAEVAAASLGVKLQKVEVRPPYDFEAAFARVKRGGAAGVLIVGSPIIFREQARIAALALKHGLPSMGSSSFGGLAMGYGINLPDTFRRAAEHVDKILKGAKPADLPVEQPTKFELVINLKTAKALGLTIPPSILIRADQVIE